MLTSTRHLLVVHVQSSLADAIHSSLIVITRRDIVTTIDQCREAHSILFVSADRTKCASILVADFMMKCRQLLNLDSTSVQKLVAMLKSTTGIGLVIELPAHDIKTFTLPEIPLQSPAVWRYPHPYSFASKLFWPAPCAELLLANPALPGVEEACRRAAASKPSDLFDGAGQLHSVLTENPFLPFFLAALANNNVRNRWKQPRMQLGSATTWAYILYRLLVEAVRFYWTNDAEAADGVRGIPGLQPRPLAVPRLNYLLSSDNNPNLVQTYVRFESTLGFSPRVNEPTPAHPLGLDKSFPYAAHITHTKSWIRLPSMEIALRVASAHTGLIGQIVRLRDADQWYLVAECALDEFAALYPEDGLIVPIETQRVCRKLLFFGENEPLPAGSVVLERGEWSSLDGLADFYCRGNTYLLVDLEPGTFFSRPAELDNKRRPLLYWPLNQHMLHPLRSAPGSTRVLASGYIWDCSLRGPSVCLNPPPLIDSVRTVVSYQLHHFPSSTLTHVYLCSPPAMAAMPMPLPSWCQCRLGCTSCSIKQPVAVSGATALICREELPCVLWWHWMRFAEWMLCWSDRAEQLGVHWLRDEFWKMKAIEAAVVVPTTRVASVIQQPQPQGVVSRGKWEINKKVVDAANRRGSGVEPMIVQILYLLWCISDDTCSTELGWFSVGRSLREIDQDNDLIHDLWRWWSWKYGKQTYLPQKDFNGTNGKWYKITPRSQDQDLALATLASKAKKARGTLCYDSKEIDAAIDDFLAFLKTGH